MDPIRFDRVTKLFADRKLSRRRALAQGGASVAVAGLAATGVRAAAQDASPEAGTGASEKVMDLFVQSFESGSIVPTEGSPDTYTLTLETGARADHLLL